MAKTTSWFAFAVGVAFSAEPVDLSGLPASTSAFVLSDMREHVLLFCLLGLVLTATIILVIAPGAVTWALALIE